MGWEEEIRFEKILRDIKSVKIQGAENVARAGIEAFLLKSDKKSVERILNVRVTEPLLQNAIKILIKSPEKKTAAKKFLKEIESFHEIISKKGAMLIKNNMNIYVHCHSSSVMDILKYAKKEQKKNFVVYTTEVEPLLQGRETARELARAGVKVIVFPDLAMETAIRNCDLFLFGADAYTKKYVVNKIGTATLVRIAKQYNVPRYSCGVSLKFTNKVKIEKRSGKEVWDEREKNIIIENYAFDKARLKDLTGVVCEFGILKPRDFVKKAKENVKKILGLRG
jgi:ribose 1,5-bisphosphate isomerase